VRKLAISCGIPEARACCVKASSTPLHHRTGYCKIQS